MTVQFDTSDLLRLSADLGRASAATTRLAFGAFKASGEDLKSTWARNATATAGKHGKHYPKSITTEMRASTNIEVETGPDPRLPQGGMSFEYGSSKQPPHLDGQKAMDEVLPRLEERVNAAMDGVAAVIGGGGSGLREYTTKAGVTRMATDAQIANWTRGSA